MNVAESAVLAEILRHVSAERVVRDPAVTATYSRDQAAWAPVGAPLAVVRARSAEEVRAVVTACYAHRVPVVPRGAGTGLSGGANATDGCVVLALDGMDRDPRDQPARAARRRPARGRQRRPARRRRRARPVVPARPGQCPWSTIGGNVATNAGGLCCVKYGVTRDYVLGLEVVTGTGELVRLGRRTAKGVAGLRSRRADGRLGGHARRGHRGHRAAAPAAAAGDHGRRATSTRSSTRAPPSRAVGAAGITPAALELVDRHCLQAVDAWKNMGLALDAEVVLLGARRRARRAPGEALADRDRRLLRGGRRDLGGPVDRRGRGRGAVRTPAGWPIRRSSGSARC